MAPPGTRQDDGRARLSRRAATFALLLALVAACQAGPSPLSAEVQPLTLRPRTNAPAFVDITLHSHSHAALEGTLEMQLWADGELLFLQQLPDLTLPPGTTARRLLLPPPPVSHRSCLQEARLQFSTRSGVYDLGRFPLDTSFSAARQYLIGVCRGDAGLAERQSLVWQALRPERLFTGVQNAARFVSSPAWFAPEDLPSSVGLCAFDVVVCEGATLAALSPKQLTSLAVWVEAGGSLCVVAPRALDAEHAVFLNRLGSSREATEPFARESDGSISRRSANPSTAAASGPIFFHKAQLGRLVVAFAPPSDESEILKPDWTKADRFLAHSNATGKEPLGAEEFTPPEPLRRQYSPSRFSMLQEYFSRLPSHFTRPVPVPVLVAILGGFVLLVGPGEWFALGYLRRRRWTWLTFPAFAAGCTLLTIRVAGHYLGSEDQRVALVITDFSRDGRPLRENRFEMWIAGRNQEGGSEMREVLAVPTQNTFEMPGRRATQATRNLPLYQGAVPAHYALRRQLFQWTPYLQRTLAFTPQPSPDHLHWAALEIEDAANFGPQAAVQAAESIGAKGWTVAVFRHLGPGFSPRVQIRTTGMIIPRPSDAVPDPPLLQQISVDDQSIYPKSFSPSGQPDLLDLLLDCGEFDRVIVAERWTDHEIQVQRCVYHFRLQ